MLSVLANRTYRHLFLAQVIALVGTGLATVALGLLAYEIAGADAGAVLGGALAIKMVAYIGVGPVVNAFVDRLPRRAFLVSMDLVRAAVALALPFVTEVWQVYVLIFALQSASAAFSRPSRPPSPTSCRTRSSTRGRFRFRAWPTTPKALSARPWPPPC
jgi:MFS family permease